MQINRRKLRKKLGSRSSRRQGVKRGRKTRPRTLLALAIEKEKLK